MKKYIAILLILILSLALFNISFVEAKIGNPDAYKPSGSDTTFKDVGSPVIRSLQVIAAMVSVGTLAILGIRYMLESPDGRADIKSKLIPYLIGAVMAFAMIPILSIMYRIFK